MARLRICLSLFLLAVSCAIAQNPPQSDPQALAFAAQAMTAMTAGTPITDVTLMTNVTWVIGAQSQTGTANLLAKGTTESRIDLTTNSTTRTDIRNVSNGLYEGTWALNSTPPEYYALHNCYVDSAWFFPALTSLSAAAYDTSLIFSYVGGETRGGTSVQHIASYRYIPNDDPNKVALTTRLSTVDYYLDSQTSLPVSIAFNSHPDDDAGTDIPVEVDFANYQLTNGATVAFHVQEYWKGDLLLDATVTQVTLNSGLSDDLFAIQAEEQ